MEDFLEPLEFPSFCEGCGAIIYKANESLKSGRLLCNSCLNTSVSINRKKLGNSNT